jgi:uncharacterized protein (TIGR03437 family)
MVYLNSISNQSLRFFLRSGASPMQLAVLALFAIPALAGQVSLLPRQPGAGFGAIQIDRAGDIYLAGAVTPSNAKTGDVVDAVVAKLAVDGSPVYRTLLAGSALDEASAIALGKDGSVYVTGFTFSKDFPVTSGALQPTLGTANGRQAFLAKLSPSGQIQSATYFGGSAQTSGSAIAIANTGEVYLTGTSSGDGFPTTPGNTGLGNGFFLAKFDANLSKVLFATLTYGGTVLALDPQGNIYAAAAATGTIGLNAPLQTSPGAFQNSTQVKECQGGVVVFLPCSYQFVEKLDPTGTKLGYATFITGSFGASPAGIAVDPAGNVIVAGTTNSADYPVTAQAFQTVYLANAAAPPSPPNPNPGTIPPPSTGYITKLNAAGTGMIWSTFFGGSVQDAISGMVVDANGYIYITGQASSNDLPGLSASDPAGCRPAVNQGLGFVTRLSPDGTSLSPTQLIYGAPVCTYTSCFPNLDLTSSRAWALAVEAGGSVIATGGRLGMARVDLFASQRLACFTDPADNVQITTVAPGQVFSIFGSRLALSGAATSPTVTFNGVSAPILYTSGEQINIQVPFEIAGQDSVEMQVVSPGQGLMERKTFSVVQQMPSVFLSPDALLSGVPGYSYCGNAFSRNQHALALNSDGTLNTCSNRAQPGSTVTLFMNGLGLTQPPQATGSIVAGPPIVIAPGATGTGILSTTTSPGAISGVAQVQVQVQPTSAGFLEVVPTVAGIPPREPVVIWVAN